MNIFDASDNGGAQILLGQGFLPEPLLFKFYYGGPKLHFGLPPSLKSLEAYIDMLKGVRANWFAATLGGDNLALVPLVVSLGGHGCIGLEDYRHSTVGQLTNPALACRAADPVSALRLAVA